MDQTNRERLMIPPCSRAQRKWSSASDIWTVVRGMTEQARHQAIRRGPGIVDRQFVCRQTADEVTAVD